MHQPPDYDPADLYEPYWYMSYPRWGIFGFVHPYSEIASYGGVLAFGLFIAGFSVIDKLTGGAEWLFGGGLLLLILGTLSGFGLFQGIKRATWMHRYKRITGVKPPFGDPANKPPGYDNRRRLARDFLP